MVRQPSGFLASNLLLHYHYSCRIKALKVLTIDFKHETNQYALP